MAELVSELLGALRLIGELKPGQTLSTTSLSIVEHDSWNCSLWRRYSGESRNETLAFIEKKLAEGCILYQATGHPEMLIALQGALEGYLALKETYRGDHYIVGQINRQAAALRERLTPIPENEEQSLEASLALLVAEVTEEKKVDGNESDGIDLPTVVEASDRDCSTNSASGSVLSSGRDCLATDDSSHLAGPSLLTNTIITPTHNNALIIPTKNGTIVTPTPPEIVVAAGNRQVAAWYEIWSDELRSGDSPPSLVHLAQAFRTWVDKDGRRTPCD